MTAATIAGPFSTVDSGLKLLLDGKAADASIECQKDANLCKFECELGGGGGGAKRMLVGGSLGG